MDIQNQLHEAKQAISEGNRERGRTLLIAILRDNPNFISAWLWLSGVVEDHAKKRECLERVLSIEPNNAVAQHGLEVLNMQAVAERAEHLPPPPEIEKTVTVKRLGEYLVTHTFITQQQLTAALNDQAQESRYGRIVPLGDILLRRRWLTMQALNKALQDQQKDRNALGLRSNRRLGEYLVKEHLISERQLTEVIARQASLKRQGQDFQLGELLVLSGMLSRDKLQSAVDEHQQSFLQKIQ